MWGVCPESPEDIESSTFKSFLFLAAAAEYNLVIHQFEAKRKCWQQMDIVFAKKTALTQPRSRALAAYDVDLAQEKDQRSARSRRVCCGVHAAQNCNIQK